jgi:hypothetical protein
VSKILAAMPEDKTKFTILIDRVNATAANQDIEMVKAMSAMYQVSEVQGRNRSRTLTCTAYRIISRREPFA